MLGSVSSAKPPMTPARPASALPTANTSTKMRGTSCPSALDHLRMRQRGLDDEADARALEREVEEREHAHRDRHHQPLVGGIAGAEEREQREVDRRPGTRFSIGLRPQTIDDALVDEVGEAEREQDLRRRAPACARGAGRSARPRRRSRRPAAARSTSAGQKPIQRPIWKEKYAPSMNMLACAKLSTPIMLKISVSPLDSMNSSRP